MARHKLHWGILGILALVTSTATAAPPAVAEFRIESERVLEALGDRTAEFEDVMASELAAVAASVFGFMDWSAGDLNASQVGVAVVVTAVSGGDCGTGTHVHFEAADGLRQARIKPPVELYEPCRTPPFLLADLGEFRSDLLGQVNAMFAESVGGTVFRQILSKVEIGSRIDVRHAEQQVVLPLSMADLKAGEESVFRVEFSSTGGSGTAKLDLQQHDTLGSEGVHCFYVNYLRPPDVTEEAVKKFWHPTFSQEFSPHDPPTVRIFMAEYSPNPFAGDGLDPPGTQ